MSERIVALVPMRHQSERVPGKNYRPLGGQLLYRYIVKSLLQCGKISEVVIDTDSPVILEDAARMYPEVRRLQRPEHLRDGKIPMNDVLLNDVKQLPADYYLQTHSTNPFLSSATIGKAIDAFLLARPEADSLFSVTRRQTRLWDAQARPVNHDPAVLLRTQDLPPLFEENSCLYIFSRSTLELMKNRIGEHPLMFEIDPIEAWDIDEEIDFRMAELINSLKAGGS